MAKESTKLGQYTLLEKIAQGGMAQIFKAKTVDHTGFERLVVIKRILPHISADPEYVEMLIDEAKIAVNFTHGNIAQIYDLGRVKDDYFIVMEYVDGKTMSHINKKLKRRQTHFPVDILLYCAIEICRGLSYIHNKKDSAGQSLAVVHRDISPQNIILSYAGNIKVIDFGVAKATVKEGKTESGVLKGKFAYMSPEQARSDNVNSLSDIFSMGTLLWELATTQRLFKRKTNHETVQAIQKAKYDAASSVRSDLPSGFDKIIKKALQKNPKNRYQDAADMAHDLEKLLFKVNPEFKPVFAAEFVYKLFGPESDEMDLPDHIFTKEPTPVTRVQDMTEGSLAADDLSSDIEDPTIKEYTDHATPIVKMVRTSLFKSQYFWTLAFFIFMFLAGTTYVYVIHHFESASIELVGYQDGMKVTVDGDKLESVGPKITLEVGTDHVVLVSKSGHIPFKKEFSLKSNQHLKIKVSHKLIPPKVRNLIIKTKPAGATVYLNNMEWKQRTPAILSDLKIGQTYKLGLFLQKHEFYRTEVKMTKGDDLLVEYDFVKNVGYLSITSNPLGATVKIDGDVVGQTPFQDSNIKPKHEFSIELNLEGYQVKTLMMSLEPGEEKSVNIDLETSEPVMSVQDDISHVSTTGNISDKP